MSIARRSSLSESTWSACYLLRAAGPPTLLCRAHRSDGGDDDAAAAAFDAALVGRGHPLDHVGVRVRAPYERQCVRGRHCHAARSWVECTASPPRSLEWYARNLGFNALVNKYPANEEPLKNFRERKEGPAPVLDSRRELPLHTSTHRPAAGSPVDHAVFPGLRHQLREEGRGRRLLAG